MNRQKTTVPGDGEIAGSNAKETPKEGLDHASHEYRRRKALAELAHLGIPVIRYDPTTSDVPLPLKIEGGSVRTDFDPATPLARGHVVDVSDIRHSPQDHNPTTTTRGKLFLQLTMRDEDQRRLFSKYPQRNYIPIHEDFQMILEYQSSLDLISIGMHDYNPDDTHLWPGV
ncbi:MAG: hypothetical protein KAU31_09360, partial [Spirochaetaceae bacterium]|nr:hypothetical protein [Spirochaetaceae bacterium]